MMISQNGLRVLQARYLRGDGDGRITETPEQLFDRVARSVSEAELLHVTAADAKYLEERFHSMLSRLDFLPNSPTLMNAGSSLGQLSACFVLPVEDSMESIFGTLSDAALIQRTGGGTGFSFSHLRPAGDPVASTGGSSSGPVSFMRTYDCAIENIKLGDRRRGANMGVLRVDHPDIEEFIRAKRDGVSFRNFNISVGATIARTNPLPARGEIEATNPCGELPLLPYESCNLGSINFVRDRDGAISVDFERLRTQVEDGVRFLDDVISVNRFPLDAIARATLANRKIGLGIMGFAEMCILLGISDASEVAAAYLLAYRLGCKGVTVFRYGSKSETMLELGVGETSDERGHFTKCDPEACRL